MNVSDSEQDREYVEFIRRFNEGEYEESHQTLLLAWQHNVSDNFYKGLIQLAGAFQHWAGGNTFWAEDLFATSYNLLEPYAPEHLGLNVSHLLGEIQRCHAIAREAKESGAKSTRAMPAIRLLQSQAK